MIIKFEKVVMEGKSDYVDYVSKGLPPKKEEFNKLVSSIRDIASDQSEEDISILSRVYENQKKNLRWIAAGGGILLGALVGTNIGWGVKYSRLDKYADMLEDENEHLISSLLLG